MAECQDKDGAENAFAPGEEEPIDSCEEKGPGLSPLEIFIASNEKKLGSCLGDLFTGPSRGIEEAFGIILRLMAKQAADNDELKSSHEELKKGHEELRQLADANLAIIKKAAEENKRLAADNAELRDEHEKAKSDIKNLTDSINVLAYNFGFGEVDDDEGDPDSDGETLGGNSMNRNPLFVGSMASRFLSVCRGRNKKAKESVAVHSSKLVQEQPIPADSEGNEEETGSDEPEGSLPMPQSDGENQPTELADSEGNEELASCEPEGSLPVSESNGENQQATELADSEGSKKKGSDGENETTELVDSKGNEGTVSDEPDGALPISQSDGKNQTTELADSEGNEEEMGSDEPESALPVSQSDGKNQTTGLANSEGNENETGSDEPKGTPVSQSDGKNQTAELADSEGNQEETGSNEPEGALPVSRSNGGNQTTELVDSEGNREKMRSNPEGALSVSQSDGENQTTESENLAEDSAQASQNDDETHQASHDEKCESGTGHVLAVVEGTTMSDGDEMGGYGDGGVEKHVVVAGEASKSGAETEVQLAAEESSRSEQAELICDRPMKISGDESRASSTEEGAGGSQGISDNITDAPGTTQADDATPATTSSLRQTISNPRPDAPGTTQADNATPATSSSLLPSIRNPRPDAPGTAQADNATPAAASSLRPIVPNPRPDAPGTNRADIAKPATSSSLRPSILNPTPETTSSMRPTVPNQRPGSRRTSRPGTSKSRKRASFVVSRQKLNMDQTLAVRLGKLEDTFSDLEDALKEVKGMQQQLGTLISNAKDARKTPELSAVHKRIGAIEQFLGGFYETKEDTQHDSDGQDKTKPLTPGGDEILETKENTQHNSDGQENTEPLVPGTGEGHCDEGHIGGRQQPRVTDGACHSSTDDDSEREHSKQPTFIRNSPRRLSFFISSQVTQLAGRIDDLSQRFDSMSDQLAERVSLQGSAENNDGLGTKLQEMSEFIREKISMADLDCRLQELGGEIVLISDLDGRLQDLRDELVPIPELDRKLQDLRNEIIVNLSAVGEDTGVDDEIVCNDFKTRADRELQRLRVSKADRSELLEKLEQYEMKVFKDLDAKIDRHETDVSDSLRIMHEDINTCRQYMDAVEGRLRSPDENRGDPADDLNQQIKQATEAVHASVLQELTERLNGLKAVESEVDKLASRMAEKPDQDQIDAMLKELKNTFSQRIQSDDALQGFFDKMKHELHQKMTRTDVLTLVRHFLNEAKQDVAEHKDSLMVGRAPFRCLGCDQPFKGVHNRRATKVNHQALPSSGQLTPNFRRERGLHSIQTAGRPGGLRPLQMASQRRGRPRTTGAVRQPLMRSASLDSRKPWRNRSR